MLFNILLANPEAAKSGELLYYLENEISNPLPSYIIDIIRQSWLQPDVNALLQRKIRLLENLILEQTTYLVRLEAETNTLNKTDNVNNVLSRSNSLYDLFARVDNLYTAGRPADASMLSNAINDIKYASVSNEPEKNAFIALRNWKNTIGNKSYNNLDSGEVAALTTLIGNYPETYSAGLARNIKCFFLKDCEKPQVNTTFTANKKINANIENKAPHPIKVYPVPCNDYITFSFLQKEDIDVSKEIKIYNSQGIEVQSISLPINTMNIDVDLHNFTNGVYLYNVIINGNTYIGNFVKQN
jgi:hypothetical protein